MQDTLIYTTIVFSTLKCYALMGWSIALIPVKYTEVVLKM